MASYEVEPLTRTISSTSQTLSQGTVFALSLVSDIQTYAMLALLHVVVFGAHSSMVPRSDQSVARDRQTRMAAQGGHTLMWAYFAGHGALAELIQILRKAPGAALNKVTSALSMHATGLSVIKCLLHYLAISALKDIVEVLKQQQLETGSSYRVDSISSLNFTILWAQMSLAVGVATTIAALVCAVSYTEKAKSKS